MDWTSFFFRTQDWNPIQTIHSGQTVVSVNNCKDWSLKLYRKHLKENFMLHSLKF